VVKDCISKKVENGRNTLFWTDPWFGSVLLEVRFRRLFELCSLKSCTVGEMSALGREEVGAVWQWRRRLWEWEEELLGECRMCRMLLSNVVLQDHTFDQLRWRLDPSGGYSVRSVYHMLTTADSHTFDVTSDLIWHNLVPVKVSILAWRLLRNRLPTKANLVARGIITQDAQMCVTGCGEVETTHHLFFSCTILRELWHLVRDWIGVYVADSYSVHDNFLQFTYSSGGSVTRRSFMQFIWLVCVWVLWNERNNRLFSNKKKVKIHSYWWMKVANAIYVLGVHSWLTCLLDCLGIG